jgi:hypothetical protein
MRMVSSSTAAWLLAAVGRPPWFIFAEEEAAADGPQAVPFVLDFTAC